jgi:hypothetical protein
LADEGSTAFDLRQLRQRPGEHTVIVLDTCILVRKRFFTGAAFDALRAACALARGTLVIPEVAIDELLGNYRTALTDAFAPLNRLLRERVDPEAYYQQYAAFLEEKRRAGDITVAPYTKISHEQVVRRMYEGKKPFKVGDKRDVGYKDYLIWQTVLEEGARDDGWDYTKIVFISSNTADFARPSREQPLSSMQTC